VAIIDREIDISRNIKLIEWLKSELLTDIARLFKAMSSGVKEEIIGDFAEILANIILISYLLGKRLGVDYGHIDRKINNKIRLGLVENHEVERFYGDLSELSKHLKA
jgi:hypothetical protein